MYYFKPFAEAAEVSEEKIKELTEKYGFITVIKAICEMLKTDIDSKDLKVRGKYLGDLCEMILKDSGLK